MLKIPVYGLNLYKMYFPIFININKIKFLIVVAGNVALAKFISIGTATERCGKIESGPKRAIFTFSIGTGKN